MLIIFCIIADAILLCCYFSFSLPRQTRRGAVGGYCEHCRTKVRCFTQRDCCGQSWAKTTTDRVYLHLIWRQRQEIVPRRILCSLLVHGMRRQISFFHVSLSLLEYFDHSGDNGWKVGQIACPASQRSFRGGARAFVRADIQLESRLLEQEPWKRLSVPDQLLCPQLKLGCGWVELVGVRGGLWWRGGEKLCVLQRGELWGGRRGVREALEVRGVESQKVSGWDLYWPNSGAYLEMKVN